MTKIETKINLIYLAIGIAFGFAVACAFDVVVHDFIEKDESVVMDGWHPEMTITPDYEMQEKLWKSRRDHGREI